MKKYLSSIITMAVMCMVMLSTVTVVHAEQQAPYNVQIAKGADGSYGVTFDGECSADDQVSLFIYKDGQQVEGISKGTLGNKLNQKLMDDSTQSIAVAMARHGVGVYTVGVRLRYSNGKYSANVMSENNIVYNNLNAPKLVNPYSAEDCSWDLVRKIGGFLSYYGMPALDNNAFYCSEYWYNDKLISTWNGTWGLACKYEKDGAYVTLQKGDDWVPGVYEYRTYVHPKDPNVNAPSDPAIGKLLVTDNGDIILLAGFDASQKDGIIYEKGEYCFYSKGEFVKVTGVVYTTFNGEKDYFYVSNGVAQLGYTGAVQAKRYRADGELSIESLEETEYLIQNGRWVKEFTPVQKNGILYEDGVYRYYVNGNVDTSYNGLMEYNGAWWYVANGQIQLEYNGFIEHDGAWYCVANGNVAFGYTGLWSDVNVGWWYVENGVINFNYNGFVEYYGLWWCVAGGRVAFEYTGLWSDANVGWWYVNEGKIDFIYDGLIFYNDAWWCVAGGRVAFEYTGLWSDVNVGWWYVENGAINFNYNGLVFYNDAWWCVAGGRVAFEYTGLWSDVNVGWWYVENGTINFAYTGLVDYNGNSYWVQNGQVDFSWDWYTGGDDTTDDWENSHEEEEWDYDDGVVIDITGDDERDYEYIEIFHPFD